MSDDDRYLQQQGGRQRQKATAKPEHPREPQFVQDEQLLHPGAEAAIDESRYFLGWLIE